MSRTHRSARVAPGGLLARLTLCAALGGSLAAAIAPPCSAQQAVSKEDKKRAGARFKEGEAMFQKHAYAEAADAFEEAYHIAPHPSVLWNVVNAATMAGQNARAAALCAQLVADKNADEKLREDARQKLADLRQKVGRLEIGGAKAERVEIDGKQMTPPELFVEPGDHQLEATIGGKKQRRKLTIVAGSSERILLDAPAADAPAATSAAPPPPPPPKEEPVKEPSKGLSPAFTYVGAGLTVVLGGVTTWSGIDTSKARKSYDESTVKTQADLDAGKSKQLRTNVLIGATAVVGLTTIGIALFATDWGSGEKKTTSLRVGPGSAMLEGTF